MGFLFGILCFMLSSLKGLLGSSKGGSDKRNNCVSSVLNNKIFETKKWPYLKFITLATKSCNDSLSGL